MLSCRNACCQFGLRRAVAGLGGLENLECQLLSVESGAVDMAAGTLAQLAGDLQILIENGLNPMP